MLLNYLKLSLRLLARNPFFTFINVAGLSVGFVAFFILWQYSSSELKSDQFHKDYERIARICAHWRWVENGQENSLKWGSLLSFQTGLIFSDLPQIEEHCRYVPNANFNLVVSGFRSGPLLSARRTDGSTMAIKETKVIAADPNLFEFFTIPLVHGNKKTVLKNANSVVLSEKAAARYFGTIDPVDKFLQLNDTTTLVVTGVFKDLPNASHLDFDVVFSNVGREHQWEDNNAMQWVYAYIKVSSPDKFDEVVRQLNNSKEKYWGVLLKNFPDATNPDMFLEPLKEIAFSDIRDDQDVGKSRATLFLLQAVSAAILMMAWVNYMNLSLSRISKRSREIATRKVSGAHQSDFLNQFLVESFLINVIALVLAFTIVQLIRQPFQVLFNIPIPDLADIALTTWVAVATFITSGILITALYPTFLSNRYSHRALQTQQGNAMLTKLLPSSLTVFQYGTAIILISWTFVVYLQLNHVLEADFMKKDQVMVVDAPIVKAASYPSEINTYLNQMRSKVTVTFSTSNLAGGVDKGYGFGIKRPQSEDFYYPTADGGVDETFLPFFGIKLLAGRNFRPNERREAVLISEKTALRIGIPKAADAIGAQVHVHKMRKSKSEFKVMEVVGVYADYPIYSKISNGANADEVAGKDGTVLFFKDEMFDMLVPDRIEFLVTHENFKETLAQAEEAFHKIFPESIFNWYFLSDQINAAYGDKKINRNQISFFTGLAIAIACLGLLGAITNKAEEKMKEVGIRKVLGASMRQISSVLLRTATGQMVVATVLGLPVAFFLCRDYLRQYTDQMILKWWHFASPVMMLIVIMLGTVAVVLYKAAKANPVEALKYE